MDLTNKVSYFPNQQLPTSEKNDEWVKKVALACEALIYSKNDWIRQSQYRKKVNYNLANNILDEEEIHKVFNPLGIKYGEFPAAIQHYNIAMSKIDLLIGEELKRNFDWRAISLNEDSISERDITQQQKLFKIAMDAVLAENYDENVTKRRILELNKYMKYEWMDVRELAASRVLNYLWHSLKLKNMFNVGFTDALICGEEIYRTDIIGGNPIIAKVNPLNLFCLRNGDSNRVEDAEIIVEVNFMSPGRVIEEFYEYLTPADIKFLEDGGYSNQLGTSVLNHRAFNPIIRIPDDILGNDKFGNNLIEVNNNLQGFYGGYFNENGEVRVMRIRWKSRLKRYKRYFYDEDGEQQMDIVSEYYKLTPEAKKQGERLEEIWINEWWETTRIANEMYVKSQPREVQFRNISNPAICGSGYVGQYYNINDSKALSLMDRMKPFQYLYNIVWRRLELALAKYKGPLYKLNMNLKPDKWDLDRWFYYMEAMGYVVEDPFNEGQKGAATGKLAGSMNTMGSSVLDASYGNYIQQQINMLQYIEQLIGKIAGVTDQREGQISSSESVGGVERSVTQSAMITEKWFRDHEDVKLRALTALLETAKYAWRDKKNVKLQYILNDLERVYFEIDGTEFCESEFGLFILNSAKHNELHQTYTQLAHAAMQNDKINFSQLISIITSESITDIRRKLEGYESEKLEEARIQQEEQNKLVQQQTMAAQQAKEAEIELKRYEIDSKIEIEKLKMKNNLEVELLKIDSTERLNDENNNGINDELEMTKLKILELQQQINKEFNDKKIQEEVRKNKANEELTKKKIEVDKIKANKPTSKTTK